MSNKRKKNVRFNNNVETSDNEDFDQPFMTLDQHEQRADQKPKKRGQLRYGFPLFRRGSVYGPSSSQPYDPNDNVRWGRQTKPEQIATTQEAILDDIDNTTHRRIPDQPQYQILQEKLNTLEMEHEDPKIQSDNTERIFHIGTAIKASKKRSARKSAKKNNKGGKSKTHRSNKSKRNCNNVPCGSCNPYCKPSYCFNKNTVSTKNWCDCNISNKTKKCKQNKLNYVSKISNIKEHNIPIDVVNKKFPYIWRFLRQGTKKEILRLSQLEIDEINIPFSLYDSPSNSKHKKQIKTLKKKYKDI